MVKLLSFGKRILKDVESGASKVVDQVNVADNGRTAKQRTPTSTNSVVHQITHNGTTNAAGSLVNNFTGIPTLVDTARLGTAELTHNQPAIGNATISLNKNLNRFLPVSLAEGTIPFLRSTAGAVLSPYSEHVANQQAELARQELGRAYQPFVGGQEAADANASAIKNDFYDTELANAGLNQNDGLKTDIRKIGGQAGTTAANIVFASQLGNDAIKTLLKGKSEPLAPGAVKPKPPTVGVQALKAGGANAASNVAATAQEDDPKFKDYIRSGATGAITGAIAGAAIPTVGKYGPKVVKSTVTAAKNRTPLLDNEVGAIGNDVSTTAADAKPLVKEAKDFFADKPKSTAAYQRHTMQEFGNSTPNVASADSAKFIVRGGKTMDPAHSAAFHEPASKFAKDYYKQLLADKTTVDKPVLITGGGAGAGKTSSLMKIVKQGGSLDDYAAVNDTNLATVQGAEDRIQPALKSGRKVVIAYTYRDPVEAFKNGNMKRAGRIGRIVPIPNHIDTHVDSLDTIQKIAQKYKDNPDVSISIIDNSRGPGRSRVVPIDFLKNKVYNKGELRKAIQNELQKAKTTGQISPETHAAYRTSDGPESQRPDGQRESNSRQLARPDQRLAPPTEGLESVGSIANRRVSDIRGGRNTPKPPEDLGTPAPKKPNEVENRLTKGGKAGRQNISPETQAKISGTHAVRNTKALGVAAERNADRSGIDATIAKAKEDLDVPSGQIDDKVVARVGQAIERASAAGRDQEAADLHDSLSAHLVKNGQTIQAARLLYKLTPQGLYYKAARDLKRGGVDLTPELDAKLRGQVDAIKNAADPEAKDMARARFEKTVANALPQSALDNITSVWKAGLLSGVRTQQGNLLSNATFAALKKVADVPAVGVDKAISMITKNRTKTMTNRGIVSGTKEGVSKGITTLRSGIDARTASDKYEQHADINFKNPIVQKVFGMPANFIFRGMNAADQPFYYSSFKNSMYDQAKAAGITKGLEGAELKKFMDDTVAKPDQNMLETAKNEADKSVLGYDTVASRVVAGAHKAIDHAKMPEASKGLAHTALNVLAPFVRVPSAFLSRTIDFTPLGVGKEIFHQIANKKFDQRAFSQAVGEGLTGTGVIALGISLAQQGLISGNYPSDPKEQQRWKAEGITPNSVKVGNNWYSLNYAGPVGLLMNAGRNLQLSDGESAAAKAGTAIGGFGQSLLNQSFLQGFSGFTNAITDPQRSLSTYVKSEAGSLVPAFSNDAANFSDKYQRQADTPLQSIESRVPGLREKLPIKEDVYGNDLQQPAGQANTVNALRPSTSMTNKSPAVAEVARLHNVDPGNADLQVTPTPIKKVISVESNNVTLNTKQQAGLQKQVGQAIQSSWNDLVSTPEYQRLLDVDKAKALSDMRTDVTSAEERRYVVENSIATYDKAPTKAVQLILDGSLNPSTYATKADSTTSTPVSVSRNSSKTKTASTAAKSTAAAKSSAKSTKSTKASGPKLITSGLKTATSAKSPKIPSGLLIKTPSAPKLAKAKLKKSKTTRIATKYKSKTLA